MTALSEDLAGEARSPAASAEVAAAMDLMAALAVVALVSAMADLGAVTVVKELAAAASAPAAIFSSSRAVCSPSRVGRSRAVAWSGARVERETLLRVATAARLAPASLRRAAAR